MIPVTETLLDEMVQAIVAEVDPEQVILFGSRARGDERESSDIDLIVVEAEPFGPERSRHKELVRLYHALAGFRVPADVLVYSHEDIDYWRDSSITSLRGLCGKGRCSMSDLKCARMLLDAAKRDVDALRVIYRSGEVSDEVFGFHVQQATEKLLKAWIACLARHIR